MAINVLFSSVLIGTTLRPPKRTVRASTKPSFRTLDRFRSDFGSRIQTRIRSKESDESVDSHYQLNIWDYESLQHLKTDHCDEQKNQICVLVEEIRSVLREDDMNSSLIVELIDKIQRFGLGYHFEEDIKKALEIRLVSLEEHCEKNSDLHVVALSFRLLRQHGYNISHDVFKNFMDHEGNFKEGVEEDVKGMLSLYEASHLGLEGEDILVEAIKFTKINLLNKMSLANTCNYKISKGLGARVRRALEAPLHHRTQREEARWSIEEEYQNNDEETTKYPILLELAKLDFNMVQSSLQKDLKEVLSWWKEIGLSSKLSFARDRLVETFFCVMGSAYEPQQSKCLTEITKLATLVTTIDDIYDVHGTLDELEIFTNAVKRWDIKILEELPDYMKLCYFALYNTVNEMAYNSLKQHECNIIPHLSKAWGDLCETFMQEARWNHNKETPKIKEYLETSWLSSSGALCLVHAYFLVSESEDITKEALYCLDKYHHILHHPSLLFRLYNDSITSKKELESRESANSIVCYMKETGASREQGRERVRELIEETWRKMNTSNFNGSPFSRKFIETSFNVARMAHSTYQHSDTFGAPDIASMNRIKSLIMEPISFSIN